MPNKEWTDEEVKAEIAAAIQIVREDRFDAFLRTRETPPANNPPGGNNPSPPGGNDGGNNPLPKKKSLWWGEETS